MSTEKFGTYIAINVQLHGIEKTWAIFFKRCWLASEKLRAQLQQNTQFLLG